MVLKCRLFTGRCMHARVWENMPFASVLVRMHARVWENMPFASVLVRMHTRVWRNMPSDGVLVRMRGRVFGHAPLSCDIYIALSFNIFKCY